MNNLLVAGAILTLMGLGFLNFCVRYLWSTWKSKREGVLVAAQVVGAEERSSTVTRGSAFSSGDRRVSRTYSFPVVEFPLPDGRLWRASTDVNAATPIPPGTTVQVRYLPSDPNKVRLARNSVGFIPYIFLVLGVGLLTGGLVMLGFGAEIL